MLCDCSAPVGQVWQGVPVTSGSSSSSSRRIGTTDSKTRAQLVDAAAELLAEDGSLRTLWKLNVDPAGAAFSIEFAALANHRKAIRAEVARYAERFRNAQ